jgi:hypothetical protein
MIARYWTARATDQRGRAPDYSRKSRVRGRPVQRIGDSKVYLQQNLSSSKRIWQLQIPDPPRASKDGPAGGNKPSTSSL